MVTASGGRCFAVDDFCISVIAPLFVGLVIVLVDHWLDDRR
ncbi:MULTISPECIES: type I toxin-antitoxin system Fst family toxin [Amylolactobacillus]|nr:MULTISPECIES: type I toxin-antitoxin system Fst family toxin [Amylolactobacillus]